MAIVLHAYNFYQFDDLTFLFTTDAGDEYQCYFISYAEYFASQPDIAPGFFSFNLKLVSNNGKPFRKGTDKRIADTGITIVGDFLSSKSNAVIYFCDNFFIAWYTLCFHEFLFIVKYFNPSKIKLAFNKKHNKGMPYK